MSEMQKFHRQLLSTGDRNGQAPYIQALHKLSKASQEQLKALTAAPSWEPWTPVENE